MPLELGDMLFLHRSKYRAKMPFISAHLRRTGGLCIESFAPELAFHVRCFHSFFDLPTLAVETSATAKVIPKGMSVGTCTPQ